MLNVNPKLRPTVWDIMNKPFVKKRIINYMTEIFSGNYPEAKMPNDVDDVFFIYFYIISCVKNVLLHFNYKYRFI